MTLSVAFVLIFILYLVDKNKIWRPAAKVAIGLIVLGVLGVGGFFAWTKYDDWRVIRDATKAQQAHEKLVDACVARYSTSGYKDPYAEYGGVTLVRETCESNPDADWSQAPAKQVPGKPPQPHDKWEKYAVPPAGYYEVPPPAPFDPNKPYNSVIEIHGGETLKIIHSSGTTQSGLDMSKSVPILYLGHHQTFVMACGNLGEAKVPKTFPRMEEGNTVCQ